MRTAVTPVSETQDRLANALTDRSDKLYRQAKSPRLAAARWRVQRGLLREEARRCDVLRAAILAADPLDLDAVVDRK
jgi:hypothetical protein